MHSASTWKGCWRCVPTRCWSGNPALPRRQSSAFARCSCRSFRFRRSASNTSRLCCARSASLRERATTAERAASDYERRIQELRDRYRGRTPLRVFIEVDDRPLYTVNGQQIISEIVELCGGRNVFADLQRVGARDRHRIGDRRESSGHRVHRRHGAGCRCCLEPLAPHRSCAYWKRLYAALGRHRARHDPPDSRGGNGLSHAGYSAATPASATLTFGGYPASGLLV